MSQTSGGLKHDQEKLRTELLSSIAMEATAGVLTYGAKKYAAHNWRKGIVYSRLIGAAIRHLFAFMRGEDLDFDPNCDGCKAKDCKMHSGLPHIDHAACCIMFLQEFYRTTPSLDDRYKGEPKA